MTYYVRNLPHWHPEHATFFVTWRLFGSLPVQRCTARNGCATPQEETAGEKFRRLDRELDAGKTGPQWLRAPGVAALVMGLILKGEKNLGYFSLHAFVIMSNHVHMLFTPKIELPRIMNGLKGSAARGANAILKRTGEPFWQDESYDHWVRSGKEFGKIQAYIENNPVAAGLVEKAEEWPWSSAAHVGRWSHVG